MKKKNKGKVIDEGLLPPTDEVCKLGLVVGGIPVPVVRPRKASAKKTQKGGGGSKGKRK
jgi:hypothetical protein